MSFPLSLFIDKIVEKCQIFKIFLLCFDVIIPNILTTIYFRNLDPNPKLHEKKPGSDYDTRNRIYISCFIYQLCNVTINLNLTIMVWMLLHIAEGYLWLSKIEETSIYSGVMSWMIRVFILDGSTDHVAQSRRNFFCEKKSHFFDLNKSLKHIKKPVSLYTYELISEWPSYISTMSTI